ncbi:eukaryotic translation initiation factor 4 gamma 3-like [Salarias fasciatus]|uniref:eukaryotic translation initiation factor 4 gamma 3-like n=1 Tax=Salarias fasciatus TaxID=181472 RepID=UPI00117697E0|nr:eukaryotic translation initiation factor 4 gamma 3-like [Salarias fasciatus]
MHPSLDDLVVPGSPRITISMPNLPQEAQVRTFCLNNGDLNKCSNAWRPRMKRSSPAKDPEMLQTEDLLRQVRVILNKLTPERFDRLVEQVLELNIDSEERLSGVVDLVFQKAIDEPSFSVMYGQLCHRLALVKVQMAEKADSTMTFRRLLLRRCQKEFDMERSDDVVVQKKQAELDSSASATERERLQEELEDIKTKARRRSLGLVKLIGELFKLKMLTAAIIFSCTSQLLEKQDEDSLQGLCALLTTVGKELDAKGAKKQMDQMFNQIQELIQERRTSARIRFMLQDVVALKEVSWVPRKADQGPKTLLQVHQEAEMEQQEEQLQTTKQLFPKTEWRRAGTSVASPYRNKESSFSAPTRTFIPWNTPRFSKSPFSWWTHWSPFCRWNRWSSFSRQNRWSPFRRWNHWSPFSRPNRWCPFNRWNHYSPFRWWTHWSPFSQWNSWSTFSRWNRWSTFSWRKRWSTFSRRNRWSSFTRRNRWSTFSRRNRWGSFSRRNRWSSFSRWNRWSSFSRWNHWSPFMKVVEPVEALQPEEQVEQVEPLEPVHPEEQVEQANVEDSQIKSSSFMRAVLKAVRQPAVNASCRVDTVVLKKSLPVLRQYLDSDDERQLQALYALQALNESLGHPTDFLQMFFDLFYDWGLISAATFLKWQMSRDDAEPKGKAKAVESTMPFFTFLRVCEGL